MNSSGFTLVELLVSISLIGILSTISLTAYLNFNRSQILTQAVKKVAEDVRLAQSLAVNNQKPANCPSLQSYTFELIDSQNYRITVQCGGTVNPLPVYLTRSLPVNLTISGPNIKFKVLQQGIEFVGAGTTLTLGGFDREETIYIESGGAIYLDN